MYTQRFIDCMHTELLKIAHLWNLSPLKELKLLTVSENATFKASYADGKIAIIRVNRAFYHTLEELQSELDWVKAICSSSCNVKSPMVLETSTKQNLIPINFVYNNTNVELQVVAFDYSKGIEPRAGKDLVPWFEKLGAITAELHKHASSWKRPENFVRKYWNLETMVSPKGYWGDWRDCAELSSDDINIISEALKIVEKRLAAYHSDEKYGLIHADLRLSNLLMDNDDLIVIDYDDSGFCWYMYDFAAALSFYELHENAYDLQKAWLKGYESVKEVSQADKDEMETFIFLRRVLLVAWLTSHSDTPTAEEQKEGYAQGTVYLAKEYINNNNLEVAKDAV